MILETKYLHSYQRVGVEAPRAYYVPFSCEQDFTFKNHVVNRAASDRFLSLDGEWKIAEYSSPEEVNIDVEPTSIIPVPACVQLHGYDQIQYINTRYPFPFDPPVVPKENPTYHYRRSFTVEDLTQKYYLNFEGVDSCFYVYVNKQFVGYGQISHSTNEFDVTPFVKAGENLLDVVVVKWCAGSYLECQDKFRWTGIFRSVYLLKRPAAHITDFKITTDILGRDGIVRIENLSEIPFDYAIGETSGRVEPTETKLVTIPDADFWTAENPNLYGLVLSANGEKILQRVGIRTVTVEEGIFKINGKHIKLKGVNRHESNPDTGATVTLENTIEDLELMKWANVNAIRTSHYPDAPEFYELCDYYGFYLIDEGDLETHGVCTAENGYDNKIWQEYVETDLFKEGITDREICLYERDKNCTAVVIWSLGNESSYGKAFHEGADYIKRKDSRPLHYEGIVNTDRSEYYTDRLDVVSRMYAPVEFYAEYLADEKEKRPFVQCEYSHAMGNSNGDLNDYWNAIDSSDRFMGGFVWEWCDHAVRGEKGFLYGGDFGEEEHDGNFCVDGLVSPDRKIKSNLLELKAVYGGKREKGFVPPVCLPLEKKAGAPLQVEIGKNGEILQIGSLKFVQPMRMNIFRAYIDNDMFARRQWAPFVGYKQTVDTLERGEDFVEYSGRLVKNCMKPLLHYTLRIQQFEGGVDVTLSYEVNDYIAYFPRIGLEFAVEKENQEFTYCGYGETESYIDKHMASEYGEYTTTATKNFNDNIMPQENGSHFASTMLCMEGLMEVCAEAPFSFSVLPYSTAQLTEAKHNFELGEPDATYINLDLAMSGVGTNSCGPALAEKYRAPKKGKNTFRILVK